jgi:hypothetical protein
MRLLYHNYGELYKVGVVNMKDLQFMAYAVTNEIDLNKIAVKCGIPKKYTRSLKSRGHDLKYLLIDLTVKLREEGKCPVIFADETVIAEGIIIMAKGTKNGIMVLPNVTD